MAKYEDLPKAYDAGAVEKDIFKAWEDSGNFDPDKLPPRNLKGEPYCIVLPPPNRTGVLHLGHAKMLAIEDLMIRFERMRGKKTYWVPGTDHAAIATQIKVEELLRGEGIKDPRKELGREKFLERVRDFAEKSRATIISQCKAMGASMDWSREKYTLDEARNAAVNKVFEMMWEDKLIERGYRVVNWDPQFQTTLSDDEVEHVEREVDLVTFKYDADFPIEISTTRPETKIGDTAVAVHPDDDRFKHLIGKRYRPIFCGVQLDIKIVGDDSVDPNFGTGALGVTPAHSMVDAEIAERHGLTTIPVIGNDGKIMYPLAQELVGLSVEEARKKIIENLNHLGLISKSEKISQNLLVAQRGGTPVEQLPMRQWFVRVNKKFKLHQKTLKWKKGDEVTLKELMRVAVESGETRILPESFAKIYFHWIDNLRDWCISRQIWFGHQIPVWYKGEEIKVGSTSPGEGWERDPDTLDTWFSSGLWTFSTLGWPDEKEWKKNRAYHPTAVLETGYDILFFWVARMILMSTYVLGEVPFKDAYLHGLVRDEKGRKMSKSLGNALDPLELIPKYGTDAVRLSLVMGTSPGMDQKLSEEKIKDFRNFTNKLWNISRFILLQIGEAQEGKVEAKTLADRWILARLAETQERATKLISEYQFSQAGELLRDFTWSDLADWYLEIAKIEKSKENVLRHILQTILKLWHPYMPFVTESIWKQAGLAGDLIVAEWPISAKAEIKNVSDFEIVRNLVTDIRRLRAEKSVPAAAFIEASLVGGSAAIKENLDIVKQLARLSDLKMVKKMSESLATAVSGGLTIGINVEGAVDGEKEQAKTEKEIAQLKTYIASTQTKLKNKEFISKAPAKVVEDMKSKLAEAETKLKALESK